MATTYIFNQFLVPKYLITGQYLRFAVYFFYLIVVSLYVEMLVSLFSFITMAEMSMDVVDLEGISIFVLGITLYLIVFATSFIRLVIRYQKKERLIASLQSHKRRNEKQHLSVRADRKNHLIPLDELCYVESSNDYVRVVTMDTEYITREKITSLSRKLPDQFIRTHRSFIVNSEKVTSFTSTETRILDTAIPISRTYKKEVIESLKHLIPTS